MDRERLQARKAICGGLSGAGGEPARAWAAEATYEVAVSLRLTREVVERFKADGPGWQSRIDDALKKATGV